MLALFTPAAIPGLTVGCFLFNVNYSQALPLDILVGSLATFLACGAMYLTRNVKFKGLPCFAMAMPALFNAILVGWELTVYIGGGFWLNALLHKGNSYDFLNIVRPPLTQGGCCYMITVLVQLIHFIQEGCP